MDQDAGNPGTRQHAGVSVVKWRSRSSPLYMQALVNKTQLQCAIEFWAATSPHTVQKFYSIVLTNARIASIEASATTSYSEYAADETITLHAEQITWTYHLGSTTFTDVLTTTP